MLAQRGNTTLNDDGYAAYNIIAKEETTALSENLDQYAERLTRANARVSKLKKRINAISMNPKPLGLGLQP